MAKNLQSKFREWVIVFVAVPATLSVVVCNIFLWRLLHQAHLRDLDHEMTVAAASIEQVLASEAIRLSTLGELPAIETMIAIAERRRSGVKGAQFERVEQEWATAKREDMLVRGVLDNDLSILFRQVVEQDPLISRILLVDADGGLISASEKTPVYYQVDEPWWQGAEVDPQGGVTSEGVSQEGDIGLSLPRKKAGRGGLGGLLRAELALQTVAETLARGAATSNHSEIAVMLLGPQAYALRGPTNLSAASASIMTNALAQASGSVAGGWQEGLRYVARSVQGGLSWTQPLWVVAVREEGALPVFLYGPMLLGVAIGAAAILGVYFFASGAGRKLFFDPMLDAAEAGVWILQQASQSELAPESVRKHPWAKTKMAAYRASGVKDTGMQRELTTWFTKVQNDLRDKAASISAAMKHDLEVATEFQLALLDRPSPQVPAVYVQGRLRLEFFHEYKPALALGGDFFDVEAIAQDCAGAFVGDVMGHGIRSALITSMLRSLLQELYPQGRNAAHFMKELNKLVCEMMGLLPSQFFVSGSYFVADTTARIGTYCLAGHPPPIQLHRSVGKVIRLEKPVPRGAALGLMPEEEFGAQSVRLVDGDVFVFFTDGAYETTNPAGEDFGMTRLERALHTHIYDEPHVLLKKTMQDILAFAGNEPVADDICLLAVHVTSKPPPEPPRGPTPAAPAKIS